MEQPERISRSGVFRLLLPLMLLLSALCEPLVAATMDDARYEIRSRNYGKAVSILRGLAEQGDPDAQYQLAAMYRSGRGTPVDHGRAVHWYRKAEAQEEKGNRR